MKAMITENKLKIRGEYTPIQLRINDQESRNHTSPKLLRSSRKFIYDNNKEETPLKVIHFDLVTKGSIRESPCF